MAQRTRAASKSNPVKSPAKSPLNTSMGNEKKMSQDDVLKNIVSDLKTLKESVGKTVKSDDLKTIVSAIIKDVLKEHKSEIENLLEEKNQSLIKIIETQKCEIEGLKTQVGELAAENENLQKLAESAMSKANWNEQYSRKNNIKIHGLKESKTENVKELVQSVIRDKVGVSVSDDEILAVHRIPGRKGHQRPILLKLKDNSTKGRIMKHRGEMKRKTNNAQRFSDDVTKMNSDLINKLLNNQRIKSAWYFNGNVWGQVGERRVKFDIFDNVDEKIDDETF